MLYSRVLVICCFVAAHSAESGVPVPTTLPTTSSFIEKDNITTTNSTTTDITTTPTGPPTANPTTKPQAHVDAEVTDQNDRICIKVVGDFSFNIKDPKETITVPMNITTSGYCFTDNSSFIEKASTAKIGIHWITKKGAQMEFGFEFSQTNATWKTSNITYTLNNKAGSLTSGQNLVGVLAASQSQSFWCQREERITIDDSVTMVINNLKMQPLPLNQTHWLSPISCSASTDDNTTSSIVPIAVGCALAGLIIIVLVAYLIGRRKSGGGYQQV